MKVIIMAQGQQTRLAGAITCPKQWLRLPHPQERLPYYDGPSTAASASEPILARTLRQLRTLGVRSAYVFATEELHEILRPQVERNAWPSGVMTLENPGNSILAGLRAALTYEFQQTPVVGRQPATVLLGDVVYSWSTLRVLLRKERPANLTDKYWPPVLFAGTELVTESVGELWGCSWDIDGLDAVMNALRRIPDPPFREYQCGRLRKLLWEIQKLEVLPMDAVPDPFRACTNGRWYHPTTDYTADIDTPSDLAKLPALGAAAYADDQRELAAREAV